MMKGTGKTGLICFCFLIFLFISGCGSITHRYTPNPDSLSIQPELIPDINARGAISLINAHKESREIVIYSGGRHTRVADNKKWIDTLIKLSKRELQSRGVNVSSNSTKVLEYSLSDARVEVGMWSFRCIINVKVTTSNGLTKIIEGNQKLPYVAQTPTELGIDGAMKQAVVAIFNDEQILQFLRKE